MTCTSPIQTDDHTLISRLRQGDERAFALIYQRHSPRVMSAARRVVAEPRAAEDVTQEVFAYLWRNPERVDLERGELPAFLITVTRKRAIDMVRSEDRRRRRHERVAESHQRTDETTIDVAEALAERDTQSHRSAALYQALARLPEAQRLSVQLAYFEGCTYRQVADAMGVPEGTAKSRLRMALHRLEGELPWLAGEAGAIRSGRRPS